MLGSLFCLRPPRAAHTLVNGKDSIVLKTSSLPPDPDDIDDEKRKPPPRISEKAHNIDRNETYVLNHKFGGLEQDETLVFSLGICSLASVTHPDYLTISMLDERNLAELEISISRYSGTVAFNQQNPNETWKKEHICKLEELFTDGAPNELRVWTEEREALDGFRWREYMVSTPRRLIPTEIVRFGPSPKVRFLQIFERSDPPMLVQSHIEVSHFNPELESVKVPSTTSTERAKENDKRSAERQGEARADTRKRASPKITQMEVDDKGNESPKGSKYSR
ncbi:hypothetical protein ABW21_db0204445 [Orbilia brochopaga]|nr:hypothetical protein ABW21_db0204445 [Drechslerella brochopaga]